MGRPREAGQLDGFRQRSAKQAAARVTERIRDVAVSERNDDFHARVQAWITGRKKLQKGRKLEAQSRTTQSLLHNRN